MEQYKKIARDIRNHFGWYAKNENIELDETKIISDFLRYWFNDGKAFIAMNQSGHLFTKPEPTLDEINWYSDEYTKNIPDYYDSLKFNWNKDGSPNKDQPFIKIPAKKQLTDRQKEVVEYFNLQNQLMNRCDDAVRYIVRHYKELTEFGFIEDSGNSIFGFPIWNSQHKQPLTLYQKILRFSLLENVYNLKSFAKKELKAMGLNEKGEPIQQKPKISKKL